MVAVPGARSSGDFEESCDLSDCEESFCRICFDGTPTSPLISPCACRGSQAFVHVHCLRRWQSCVLDNNKGESYAPHRDKAFRCSVCLTRFSLAPLRPSWHLLSNWVRATLAISCLLLLALGGGPNMTGGGWQHVVLLSLLLLLGARSQPVVGGLLLLVLATVGALYSHGLRLVVRPQGHPGGTWGLAVVRSGRPVSDLQAGMLLVASQDLSHTIFRESVILILSHSDQGAEGVIINQPINRPITDHSSTTGGGAAAWYRSGSRLQPDPAGGGGGGSWDAQGQAAGGPGKSGGWDAHGQAAGGPGSSGGLDTEQHGAGGASGPGAWQQQQQGSGRSLQPEATATQPEATATHTDVQRGADFALSARAGWIQAPHEPAAPHPTQPTLQVHPAPIVGVATDGAPHPVHHVGGPVGLPPQLATATRQPHSQQEQLQQQRDLQAWLETWPRRQLLAAAAAGVVVIHDVPGVAGARPLPLARLPSATAAAVAAAVAADADASTASGGLQPASCAEDDRQCSDGGEASPDGASGAAGAGRAGGVGGAGRCGCRRGGRCRRGGGAETGGGPLRGETSGGRSQRGIRVAPGLRLGACTLPRTVPRQLWVGGAPSDVLAAAANETMAWRGGAAEQGGSVTGRSRSVPFATSAAANQTATRDRQAGGCGVGAGGAGGGRERHQPGQPRRACACGTATGTGEEMAGARGVEAADAHAACTGVCGAADSREHGAVGAGQGEGSGDKGSEPHRVLLLHGRSCWGAGQLEGELRSGAWALVPASQDDMERAITDPHTLWSHLMQSGRLRWQ